MATVTSSKRQLTHTSNTYESNGDVTIGGNLNINGTTTTIDTANLLVEDKNIIIGDVSSPSDSTADGGGITLKGASDKTINWINSTDSWTSNQRFSAPNLTLTGLSNQSSEATALVVNGSNVVGTRELGSNAFNSTSFLTGNQTITLSGDVSGSGTTSISVTVADDSHNHVISNVDGLQSALNGKLGSSEKAADSNLLDGYNAEEGAVDNSIVKRDGTASIKAFGLSLLRASTARTGITWYNESYYNWQDYMAAAGVTGCGPNGNLTAPTGLAGVTSWALRSRMEGVATYGWNWETGGSGGGGATATSKMSLNATTGNLEIAGTFKVNGNIAGNSSNTTEIGTYSTGAIKRIRMCQGGELHFGDTTTSAPLGITEGNWDSFGDNDRMSIYGRNSIKFYAGSVNANLAATLQSTGLTLNTISNATSDLDKFLVSDSGVIKYRTGSQVLSDIGAYAASNPNGYTNDQTAAEILTAIKTVDGTGTGLDADLLDGNHASAFATANQGTSAETAFGWGNHASAGYVTSSGNTIIGTDSDINTSGAAVLDQLVMTDGVITSHSTRNLTLANLGYTGATNANYITNNNQLTNGAGYVTTNTTYSAGAGLFLSGTTFTHNDTSSQGSVNNSSGTVIQDVTLDTYGHITSLGSTNLDSRYYTESEVQTFFKRGYINAQSAGNLPVGWYTIAQNTGDRAFGEFQIWDTASSRHQSVIFNAAHHYGQNDSNSITVLGNSSYGTHVFRYVRIKENGTYDGAAIQVYIDSSTNGVNVAIVGGNAQNSGWELVDWLADSSAPSLISNWSGASEQGKIDLDNIENGGIATTGKIYGDGLQTQYRMFNDNYHPNADTLTTARTIAGTSFNGSANINISYNNLTNKPTIPTNNNQLSNGAGYVTSSGNTIIGTDSDINTSGATVVDQLNMTDGVIQSHSTRTLTLANLGYTGATNANYITNNNQLTNGAGYLTTSGKAADSNLLDGIDSSSFLRSNANDTVSGAINFTFGQGAINITNSSILSSASSNWTGNPGGAGKIQYHSNRWYIVSDSSSNRIVQFRRNSSDVSYIANDGRFHGNVTGALTGNASTATQLATGRTIAGTSFDGSSNINISYNNLTNKPTIPSAYSLPLSSSSTRGGVKIGFAESGKNYPVELDSSEKMFVNVPWVDTNTDTNTTYSAGTGLSLSGTTFSITDTISSSASNNTIVKRHSSGYIFANYFNTTPNTVSSGVTQICVETGNDGYIRHGTAAAVRSFINVASGANNYSLPAGSSSTRGGFKIGYSESGKNYPVEVTSEKMYVNVPWTDTNTDTNTTYSAGRGLDLSGTQFQLETDLRDSISYIGYDSNDYVQWSNNSYFRSVVNGSERFRVNTSGIDVTGSATANFFRTDTSNTDYNLLTRNSNANAVLYVQSANSSTNQLVAMFNYGSTTAAGGNKVLVVGKDKSYFTNTKLGIGVTSPSTALDVSGTIHQTVYNASQLPSASPAGQRAFAYSFYPLATSHGSVVSTNGSYVVPVYSDGYSWRAG